MVNLPFYLPYAFLTNLSEFPTSSILLQLAFFVHISDVSGYSASAFAKQFGHLFLCKPNGLILQANIYLDIAIGVLVD
jgi:hypothetical protein